MLTRSLQYTLPLLLAVLSLSVAGAQTTDADGFTSLFNGKDLSGWEGRDDLWSVKDGAITGQTTPETELKANSFLLKKDLDTKDFELRLKFRIVDGNSGIQYRSEHKGDFVVGGYQADIDATLRYMGILYEERGRGILANRGQKVIVNADGTKENAGTTCDEKELLDSIKKEDWNEYVIIAKGNHVIQKINGHTTIDLTDNQSDKAATNGILALQIHVGPPMVVQFKDVMFKDLAGE